VRALGDFRISAPGGRSGRSRDRDVAYDTSRAFFKSIPAEAKGWAPEYDSLAFDSLRSTLQRVQEAMEEDRRPDPDVPVGGEVRYERIDPKGLVSRGDSRYGTGQMEEDIRAGHTMVPIVATEQNRTLYIADGHHRTRAYWAAGQHVPAFVGKLTDDHPDEIVLKVVPLERGLGGNVARYRRRRRQRQLGMGTASKLVIGLVVVPMVLVLGFGIWAVSTVASQPLPPPLQHF